MYSFYRTLKLHYCPLLRHIGPLQARKESYSKPLSPIRPKTPGQKTSYKNLLYFILQMIYYLVLYRRRKEPVGRFTETKTIRYEETAGENGTT